MFCGECGMPVSAPGKATAAQSVELVEPVETTGPVERVIPHTSPTQAAPPTANDTARFDRPLLDPFPWGVAPTSARAPAERPMPVKTPQAPSAADVDETRIVSRRPNGDRFVLQFSTGESVTVSGTGLLGRNPTPEPREYFDHLVTIVDPGKSVSKTHLEFGQEGGAFWVSDRYSGNGSIIREPESDAKRCDPGKRYRVVRGTRVDIGEQFFVIS